MTKKIAKILFLLSIIGCLILTTMIFINGILPRKYRILLLLVLILFEILLYFLLKKSTLYSLSGLILLAFFSILINSFASFYINSGVNALEDINKNQETEEINMSLVVMKNSKYKTLDDIKDELVKTGLTQDKKNIIEYGKSLEKEKNISLNLDDAKTYINSANLLVDRKTQVILLNESFRSAINDQIEDFNQKTRVIDSLTEEVNVDDISKNVAGDESFNVFISGIDTYGALTRVSRSDVNLILTINPRTHKMLITTVPRDSYVNIAGGGNNQKDKLTHAGIYGIESSVKTLENLFDIDINYYARVNFSTFMNLIDVLDGVDLNNDQAFSTATYDFPSGNIHLDGDKALAFARERYNLKRGDLDRGRNQEKVLKAMIEKSLSPAILLNYNSFLDIIINSTDTNMTRDKIIELINNQIDTGKKWKIDTTEVKGHGQMGLTSYAMPGSNLYMHVLDDKSINEVSKSIKNTLEEK
ncbi:MAG: LCP family protein [Peptoniphilaceae bacterium]|nr:LCP family protein [Peptoniphilaceae bacterium]MDY6019096.1 LCP family protein [Anaerococcus sp.]